MRERERGRGGREGGEGARERGEWGDSRVAVRQLVVALVGLHGELEVALLTGEAGLVPDLCEGAGQGSGQPVVKGLN